MWFEETFLQSLFEFYVYFLPSDLLEQVRRFFEGTLREIFFTVTKLCK